MNSTFLKMKEYVIKERLCSRGIGCDLVQISSLKSSNNSGINLNIEMRDDMRMNPCHTRSSDSQPKCFNTCRRSRL